MLKTWKKEAAEWTSIISFIFLLKPEFLNYLRGEAGAMDWYKTGLFVIFVVSLFIFVREIIKENKALKSWIGFPDIADLQKRGYHNLAEMIELISRAKAQEEIKQNKELVA